MSSPFDTPLQAAMVQVEAKPNADVSKASVQLVFTLSSGDKHTVELAAVGAAVMGIVLPSIMDQLLSAAVKQQP